MTTLVTGANRGIGLEHVRQGLAAGEETIATCRDPREADELAQLAEAHPGLLTIEPLEVTDAGSVAALANRLAGHPVDVLINNAGVFGSGTFTAGSDDQTLAGMDYDQWERVLRINLLGPLRVLAALRENLQAGQRRLVVMMSSDLASIAGNSMGGAHAYRTSKAALNMLSKGLAVELGQDGFTIVALTPGWTRTDLGGDDAHWPVEESVAKQRTVIARLGPADNGRFLNLLGEEVPW